MVFGGCDEFFKVFVLDDDGGVVVDIYVFWNVYEKVIKIFDVVN